MSNQLKLLRPLIVLFVICNAFLLLNKNWLAAHSLNSEVLMIANLLFFIVSLIAFYLQKKGVKNSNPNVFVRSVMGGMIIKMFVCLTALVIYAFGWKATFSKMSVFAAMILYLLYLAIEAAVATKMNKQQHA